MLSILHPWNVLSHFLAYGQSTPERRALIRNRRDRAVLIAGSRAPRRRLIGLDPAIRDGHIARMAKNASGAPLTAPCPICRASSVARWRPFCSRRCADVDLGRWLTGGYAIPSAEEPGPEDRHDDPAERDD